MGTGLPLAAKTIVITRPQQQSGEIEQRLIDLGASVVAFPLIAIEAPRDKDLCQKQLSKLADYDTLIFTSRNAVEMMFSVLAASASQQQTLTILEAMQIAAVGKQTATAIEKQGASVSIVPTAMFNSEALLEHPTLQQVTSKRIAIIRGEGGRDLLRSTLLERGAKVDYIDVYRRVCPVTNLLPLVKCQAQVGIDIIVLTSVEGIHNLFKLGADQDWLKHTELLVGSQRMADALSASAHQGRVVIADDPSDDQVVNCLLDWASSSSFTNASADKTNN